MHIDQPIISMQQLVKVFVSADIETRALAGVDLTVERGEFVCVAGPSGCGKSTLLSIMGLLEPPSEGTYRFKGTETRALSAGQRSELRNREIGFIFQSFNLIGDLTVWENIELPLTYRGMPTSGRKEQVAAALEKVGMIDRRKQYSSQLSGGQQQRVAVARALAGSPAILLADEPTGNLDSKNGIAVMELLKAIHLDGATVCMVTHDPRFASFADRTIHLLDGQVVSRQGANEREPT